MRKNLAIAICGFFAILCVGSAIGMCHVKTEPMNIDLMAALVGVLSILVTVLIGFQVINYFMIKDIIVRHVDKQVYKKVGNINHTIKGYMLYAKDVFYFRNYMVQAFDVYMQALEETIIGGDKEAIEFMESKVVMVIDAIKKKNTGYILVGYRKYYIKVLSNLKTNKSDYILNFVLEAKELDAERNTFSSDPKEVITEKEENNRKC